MTEQYDALQFNFKTPKMALARLVLLQDISDMEISFRFIYDLTDLGQCIQVLDDLASELADD